jgi:hypothetical protein
MPGDHPLPHSNVHVLSIVAMPAHDVWPAPTPPLLHTRSYTLAHIHPARAAGGACGWRSDEALSWRLSLPPLSPHLCSSITPPIFLSLLSPPPAVGALYGWVLCMGGQRIGLLSGRALPQRLRQRGTQHALSRACCHTEPPHRATEHALSMPACSTTRQETASLCAGVSNLTRSVCITTTHRLSITTTHRLYRLSMRRRVYLVMHAIPVYVCMCDLCPPAALYAPPRLAADELHTIHMSARTARYTCQCAPHKSAPPRLAADQLCQVSSVQTVYKCKRHKWSHAVTPSTPSIPRVSSACIARV